MPGGKFRLPVATGLLHTRQVPWLWVREMGLHEPGARSWLGNPQEPPSTARSLPVMSEELQTTGTLVPCRAPSRRWRNNTHWKETSERNQGAAGGGACCSGCKPRARLIETQRASSPSPRGTPSLVQVAGDQELLSAPARQREARRAG